MLQFHHLDPREKDSTVSRLISNGASPKTLAKEIAKCRVLCANCHIDFHYWERTGI